MIYGSYFNTTKTSQCGLITKKSSTLSFPTFYILPQAEDLGEKKSSTEVSYSVGQFPYGGRKCPRDESFVTSPGTNKQKICNNILSQVILTSQGAVRQNALHDISTSDGYDNQKKIGNTTIHSVFSIWTILKSKSSRWQANWDGNFLAVFFYSDWVNSGCPVPLPLSHKKDKSPLANRHIFTG